MSTETNTVLASAAPSPMDVTVNVTADAAAPKKRGRKPKTESTVGTAAIAPKKGVKKGSTGKKKEVEETGEEKPKKEKKGDAKEDVKEDAKKEKSDKKDEVKEKKAKKSKKDDAKDDAKDGDDAKPKKRSRKTGSKTNADGSSKKPRALCSYMLFVKSVRAKVAEENPSLKTTEIGKKLGEMWRGLSDDEKKAFKASDSSTQPAVAEAVVCANPSQ